MSAPDAPAAAAGSGGATGQQASHSPTTGDDGEAVPPGHIEPGRTLWVGNLPTTASSSTVAAIFTKGKAFGTVVRVAVFRSAGGVDLPSAHALVTFFSPDLAQQAKADLDGCRVSLPGASSSNQLKVLWAMRWPILVLRDLPPTLTDTQLLDTMQKFGGVTRVIMQGTGPQQRSSGRAYIVYSSRLQAAVVLDLLTENMLLLPGETRPLTPRMLTWPEPDVLLVAPRLNGPGAATPHMAQPATLEWECAVEWRTLAFQQQALLQALERKHRLEVVQLRAAQQASALAALSRPGSLQQLKALGLAAPLPDAAPGFAQSYPARLGGEAAADGESGQGAAGS